MWPFDPAPDQAGLDQTGVGSAPDAGGWGSMFAPGSLLDNKDFRRHAAYDALTNAGLGLIQASAPSSTPQNFGSMFGALAGGAVGDEEVSEDGGLGGGRVGDPHGALLGSVVGVLTPSHART